MASAMNKRPAHLNRVRIHLRPPTTLMRPALCPRCAPKLKEQRNHNACIPGHMIKSLALGPARKLPTCTRGAFLTGRCHHRRRSHHRRRCHHRWRRHAVCWRLLLLWRPRRRWHPHRGSLCLPERGTHQPCPCRADGTVPLLLHRDRAFSCNVCPSLLVATAAAKGTAGSSSGSTNNEGADSNSPG